MKKPGSKMLLLLICALAFVLRFPGVFWGLQGPDCYPRLITYNWNEPTLIEIAGRFASGDKWDADYYPKGYAFQIALAASSLKPLGGVGVSKLTLIGRALSVGYGVLTVYLLFFLVKLLTADDRLALLSALMLTLTGMHVTKSHFATTDVGVTFWIYSLMYWMLVHLRTGKIKYYLLGLACAGLALAFKLSFIAAIPVIYVWVRNKWKLRDVALTSALLFSIFYLANGRGYTLENFLLTLNNVSSDNLFVRNYNKLTNFYCYFLVLLISLGLPICMLAFWGFFEGFRDRFKAFPRASRDVLFVVLLPLIAHVISVFYIAYPAGRHLMPVIPALAVMAAAGLAGLMRSGPFSGPRRPGFLLAGIIVYQLAFIFSVEGNFLVDTRIRAEQWIEKNVPKGESLALPLYTFMPALEKNYKKENLSNARYVVIQESFYSRYKRTILNPFKEYPDWEEVFHPVRGDFLFCRGLFKGQLHYQLIKTFGTRCVTPEIALYKKVYGTPIEDVGDVLIYRRED